MTTPFNPLTRQFSDRLARLGRYQSMVEDFLAAERTSFDAKITAGAANFPPDEQQEYFEAHIEDYMELSDELPTILRNSILTSANPSLERYLDDTCRTHMDMTRFKLDLEDLSGSGLQRAQLYLKKAGGIVFPDQDDSWATVLRLRELRNSIVHAEGHVPESRAALAAWLAKRPGVRISANRYLNLEKSFVTEALDWYERFMVVFDKACQPLNLWASVFPPLPVEDV